MSEKYLRRHIRNMDEHIRCPVEVNRVTWDVLEMAASLGGFQTRMRDVHDTSAILRETRACVQKLIPFEVS
ncbi:MAG: hypothetical protein KAT27_01985, partial [Desulfobacterales bacterium]|nr:hypothetical protein [Desulfobacterales bacterium]